MSEDRLVYRITGGDRIRFLQGLVTNDTAGLAEGMVYAALLTPQGKYLADFFLVPDGDAVLLDVDQVGGACHVGDTTCFDARELLGEEDA